MSTIIQLKNGLTLIHEEVSHVASAAYCLMIPGGLVSDPESNIGGSLVLTELASRAAGNFDKKEFLNQFDGHGINHSESARNDNFSFRGTCLESEIDKALELLSLVILEPSFPEDSLPAIKDLFLQELKSVEDEPMRLASRAFNSQYYPQPYDRSSLGTGKGIATLSMDTIKSQWSKLFQPDGAVIAIAGKISLENARALVEKYFAKWERKPYSKPVFGQMPQVFKKHIEYDSAQTQILFAYPSVTLKSKDYFTAKVANYLLSGGMYGRLFLEVREKRGLCYSVFSSHESTEDYGRMFLYAGTTTDRAAETLEVMKQVVQDLPGSISQEELDRAKTDFSSSVVISRESAAAKVNHSTSEWWHRGYTLNVEDIKAEIESVTLERLDSYLNEYPLADYSLLTLGQKEIGG